MDLKAVRTRIAPSPTGFPHIGTIYQALFNFSFAKKHKGKFIVRIEDTDRTRFVEEAENIIFNSFDWFRLTEDESIRRGGEKGPYRQSERLSRYKRYAEELMKQDHAYYCFCTRDRLEEMRQKQQENKKAVVMYDKHCRTILRHEIEKNLSDKVPWVIRLKVPENTTLVLNDEIRGEIRFDSNLIDDQVLLKSDGFPTYHLAVVVDDHEMDITHVVRGEEWITSFPKHILLYDFFKWDKPLFFHTPVLRNPDKTKLSKRHGHTSVAWYQEQGFLPEAILNFLALMGWSHPEEKEIFSLEEFISLFDLKDVKAVSPIFDLKKLEWMNGMYIRLLSSEELKNRILAFDSSLRDFDLGLIDKLIPIVQTRIKTLKEFKELTKPFISPTVGDISVTQKELKKTIWNELSTLDSWKKEDISEILLEKFVRAKVVTFPEIYKILISTDRGLPLSDTFEAIGKEKTYKLFST